MGHLDPYKDHHNLVSLALITSCLGIRIEEEETRLQKPSDKSTLSIKPIITNDHLSQLWNLERLEALIVSWNGLLALVLNVEGWNAWVL
jgi:hypothetical protein